MSGWLSGADWEPAGPCVVPWRRDHVMLVCPPPSPHSGPVLGLTHRQSHMLRGFADSSCQVAEFQMRVCFLRWPHKWPQTAEMFSLTVLEARNPEPRWFFPEALRENPVHAHSSFWRSLACDNITPFSASAFTRLSPLGPESPLPLSWKDIFYWI